MQGLAQRENVTLFMLLNAAYAILLGRYSRQEDVVIGFPVANRPRKELESMVGFFVNMLPLRVDLSGNPGLSELLQRVRLRSLDAYSHQEVPFGKMVAELQPYRDLQFSPIFQAVFALGISPSHEFRLGECVLMPDDTGAEIDAAKYDITLVAQPYNGGLHFDLGYNSDLFEPETTDRMLSHFKRILEWMVSKPAKGINEFELLSETERQQILVEWNATSTDYPHKKCIHQLFEEQAEYSPDAPAIVFADQVITYRQLNSQANQLAHFLCEMGIGPGIRVGMYIERSAEMVTSMLAILKAGGAYVPLDTSIPPERQAFILRDTQSLVLLTLRRHLPDLPDFKGKVICADDEELYTGKSEKNPCIKVASENLAYIMYTSGSTGLPKGVCIPHRAVVRLVKNTNYAKFHI